MEPIPETRRVLSDLSQFEDAGIYGELGPLAGRAQELVPSLVGLSVTVVAEGITLTYVASSEAIAALDAVQYADGGPCVTAIEEGELIALEQADPLDEQRWQLFAGAAAAAGIRSTLSLPILGDRRAGPKDGDTSDAAPDTESAVGTRLDAAPVTAGVNLYGSRPDSFHGLHEQLAELFGAWSPGAVTNADLAFTTRLAALDAPRRLDALTVVGRAVGMLAAAHDVTPDEAGRRLRYAAARAGVPLTVLARVILGEEDR